jgi:hypothetical protein
MIEFGEWTRGELEGSEEWCLNAWMSYHLLFVGTGVYEQARLDGVRSAELVRGQGEQCLPPSVQPFHLGGGEEEGGGEREEGGGGRER